MSSIISILTGFVLPFITKHAQSYSEEKAKEAEHRRNLEIAKSDNAAAIRIKELELNQSANKYAQAVTKSTGDKFIDYGIASVRLILGYLAVSVVIVSMAGMFMDIPIELLNSEEISLIVNNIIGFYIGERCIKKAWSN